MKPIGSIAAARSTVKAVRRLAVSTSNFYASNQGAATPAAPLAHASVRAKLTATTRSVRAHAVALHG